MAFPLQPFSLFSRGPTPTETYPYGLLGTGKWWLGHIPVAKFVCSKHIPTLKERESTTRTTDIKVVENSQVQGNVCALPLNIATVVMNCHRDSVHRNNCSKQLTQSSKTIIYPATESPAPPPCSHVSQAFRFQPSKAA